MNKLVSAGNKGAMYNDDVHGLLFHSTDEIGKTPVGYDTTVVRTTIAHDISSNGILTRLRDVNWTIDSVICIIRQKRRQIRTSNRMLASTYDSENFAHVRSLYTEHTLSVMYDVLRAVHLISTRTHNISEMSLALLPVLYVVRMTSAHLHDIDTSCSQKLSIASMCLGSIILDVAIMSNSTINLEKSNKSASVLFDNAKSTASFDLQKRYPKLDVSRACSRCY